MSTRIYGMFNFKPTGKVRHTAHDDPFGLGLAFVRTGDKSQRICNALDYTDSLGKEHTVEYNKYNKSVYGPPSKGRTAALSFSFGYNLEAKVFNKRYYRKGWLKKKLIDNLSLSGSYNFWQIP